MVSKVRNIMAFLKFDQIGKVYPNGFEAVKGFQLEVEKGEFIVFVGPSGCGKTTTLRMLAGLEDITSGTISIDGRVINDMEPKDRDIAMVFQNYALYPHMTVFDNMAYGLKFRKVPKDEIKRRVEEAMRILDFDEQYLKRRPGQLSGGQKQRVALGRAIVRRPSVFLMDEPLSNLDAKLRIQMRAEITKIHRQVGATTIYVTHDQTEAMTMASRIVVMNKGLIQQIGTPETIYDYPENVFVAGFIGAPAMNFIRGVYRSGAVVFENGTKIVLPEEDRVYYEAYEGKAVIYGIRPEDCYINKSDVKSKKYAEFKGKIENIELLGFETIHYLNDGTNKLICKVPHKSHYQMGDEGDFYMDMSKYALFDGESEIRIKRDR